jgi:glycerol kinase
MSNGLILAIDQGTTNTKALAVDAGGRVVAEASAPMTVDYPTPGWAEQSATGIWDSVKRVIADVVAKTGPDFDALAISNQRETIVAWDAAAQPSCVKRCERQVTRSSSRPRQASVLIRCFPLQRSRG